MNKQLTLTWWEGFSILIQVRIGVGVLSLPNAVHKVAQGDGWISVLLSGLFIQLLLTVIWFLNKKYPNKMLYEICPLILGKFFGRIVNVLYILYFSMIIMLISQLFTDILKRWIFPNTPSMVLILFGAAVSIYMAVENIQVIARFYSFTLLFVFILILIMFPAFTFFDIRYVLPVGQAGVMNIIKGTHSVMTSMLGFELLFFVLPFIARKDKRYSMVWGANLFVTLTYTFIVFTSFVIFSPKEITLIMEPVLYMLKAFEFKLLDRIDLIFLSFWLVLVLTSSIMYFYAASVGFSKLFKLKTHGRGMVICCIPVIITLFLPTDIYSIQAFSKFVSKVSYVFVAVIPFFLLVIAMIESSIKKRNWGGDK